MPEEYARPILRSNQVCHILEYVIVGASSYETEAICFRAAYLGPGVLIVNKEKNSKAEKLSAQGFSWFVKTTVLRNLKINFQLNNVQSNLSHIMSILILLRFGDIYSIIDISTRTLTSVHKLG